MLIRPVLATVTANRVTPVLSRTLIVVLETRLAVPFGLKVMLGGLAPISATVICTGAGRVVQLPMPVAGVHPVEGVFAAWLPIINLKEVGDRALLSSTLCCRLYDIVLLRASLSTLDKSRAVER